VKNNPPDLQKLVAAAGGYDRITAQMWTEFDRATNAYQQARRDELIAEQHYRPDTRRRRQA
jgi:hypothetical protein